ncbi:MAG: hypothetical protein BVN35_01710 [Proteobacteria bacterium ST_bin11]|nr:MAG: hypothetical protein BVN35_01710 [Proteobacteria bacterium ST_bin11]
MLECLRRFNKVSLLRRIVLKSVLGPTAEMLSFVSPKESIQRKGDPDAALILRAEGFERGFPKGHPSPCGKRDTSLHRPSRADPSKSSGARRGIREKTPSRNSKPS